MIWNFNQKNGLCYSFISFVGLTEREIIAQAVLFLIAGFGTTADTLNWLCYELAINPEAQEKLIQEVDEVTKGVSKLCFYYL